MSLIDNPCHHCCKHGGVCILEENHKGLHSSGYCKWSNKDSISRIEADKIYLKKLKEFSEGFI